MDMLLVSIPFYFVFDDRNAVYDRIMLAARFSKCDPRRETCTEVNAHENDTLNNRHRVK